MASYNKVFLMGNLTRDPQVKHLPSQMVVAEFGLAVNRRYKTAAGEDKEEVAFVDCTAFGRQAETIRRRTRGARNMSPPSYVSGWRPCISVGRSSATVGWMCMARRTSVHGARAYITSRITWTTSSPFMPARPSGGSVKSA